MDPSAFRGHVAASLRDGKHPNPQLTMTRRQYWILNAVVGAFVLLLAGHFVLSRLNIRTRGALDSERVFVERATQLTFVLNQLGKRVALGAERDSKLKSIRIKFGLADNDDAGPAALNSVPAKR